MAPPRPPLELVDDAVAEILLRVNRENNKITIFS
jgi:hypothetical protein